VSRRGGTRRNVTRSERRGVIERDVTRRGGHGRVVTGVAGRGRREMFAGISRVLKLPETCLSRSCVLAGQVGKGVGAAFLEPD
jgi:hypothetical protein